MGLEPIFAYIGELSVARSRHASDRLFDAYAADAMSLEQFKRKQRQLDGEAASAQKLLDLALDTYEQLEDIATTALALARNAAPAPTKPPNRSTAV